MGCLPEMAKVRVKSLGAGYAQHDCAENEKRGTRILKDEAERMMWAHRQEDCGVGDDLGHTEHRNCYKPR